VPALAKIYRLNTENTEKETEKKGKSQRLNHEGHEEHEVARMKDQESFMRARSLKSVLTASPSCSSWHFFVFFVKRLSSFV